MRFLFVAPHPDDLEFNIPSIMFSIAHCMKSSEYATDSKIKDALEISKSYFTAKKSDEFQFKAASMTRGEMAALTDEVQSTMKAAEIRSQELINGQKILTDKEPDFLGFFDGYVKVTDEAIQRVYEYIVKLQPDYIFGPEPTYVYYIHEDHVNTGRILYFAIKRIAQAKICGELDIPVPKLFYYQSIYNHWFFPRFPEFEEILINSLKAHATQSFTLDKKTLDYNIGHLEKLLKGMKVQYSSLGEALRYQPIPNNPDVNGIIRIKKFTEIPFKTRLIYYILKKLQELLRGKDYEARYRKYYDGKMPASINATWN